MPRIEPRIGYFILRNQDTSATRLPRNTTYFYDGWNFNSGNYLFTTDTK